MVNLISNHIENKVDAIHFAILIFDSNHLGEKETRNFITKGEKGKIGIEDI